MTDSNLPPGITKETIESLKRQLRDIPRIKQNIADAEAAGIDVSDAKNQLADLEEKGKLFIKVYGNKV